jgi:hypothetical protein
MEASGNGNGAAQTQQKAAKRLEKLERKNALLVEEYVRAACMHDTQTSKRRERKLIMPF